MSEKVDCVVECLGSASVNGPLTELSLSQCVSSVTTAARYQPIAQRRFNLRLDKDGLNFTYNENDNDVDHKVSLNGMVFCYLPPDCPRAVVWVIKGDGSLVAKVWRCETAAEAMRLYRLYHQLTSRTRVGKTPIFNKQKTLVGEESFRKRLSDILSKRNEINQNKSSSENNTQMSLKVGKISEISVANNNSSHPNKFKSLEPLNIVYHLKDKVPTKDYSGKVKTPESPEKASNIEKLFTSKPPLDSNSSKEVTLKGNLSSQLSEHFFVDLVSNISQKKPSHDYLSSVKVQEQIKPNSQSQVLVAATRNGREHKPVEARQRQPAMLLSSMKKEISTNTLPIVGDRQYLVNDSAVKNLPREKSVNQGITSNNLWLNRKGTGRSSFMIPSSAKGYVLERRTASRRLLPRAESFCKEESQTNGGWAPAVSYGRWLERAGNGDPQIHNGLLHKVFGRYGNPSTRIPTVQQKTGPTPGHRLDLLDGSHVLIRSIGSFGAFSPEKSRSANVTRSGSLTSQGSTSSDSGNEGHPKSVLKKSAGLHESRKNVTFNSMTTVQVMEE